MGSEMKRLQLGIAAATAALGLALPAVVPGSSARAASLGGPPPPADALTLQRGTTDGVPWKLLAWDRSIPAGGSSLPGLCAKFSLSGGDGPTFCIAPARGTTTAGPPWVFDVDSVYGGLTPPGATFFGRSGRSLLFFVDPRATRVVASLADGERLRIPTHPVPGSLHRPVKFALALSTRTPMPRAGLLKLVRAAVAYDAGGRVVGRMSTKKSLALGTVGYG